MTTTYTWTFDPLEHEDRDGLSSVVTCIHWQVSGSDGTHDGRAIGTFACGELGDPFTNYDSLTPEVVKSWIDADVIANAEAAVDSQIAGKVEAATSNKGAGVPWS